MAITKASKIWLNGKFVPWDKAQIHVLTHGLHYGSGVFEGIRAYETSKGPAVFRLNEHINRLFNSAKFYRMQIPYSKKEIKEVIKKLIRINKLKSCYIRPIVFRGYGEMGLSPLRSPVEVAIVVWFWGAYLGEEGIKNGVKAKIVSWQRISLKSLPVHVKACGQYLNSILAKLEALDLKVDEAIMLDEKGNIAEGPGENIFMVKDKVLYTPALSSGILVGITRDAVIKIAKDLDIKFKEKKITPQEFKQADEAFFTGTAAEIVPIKQIDNQKIKKPWPVTLKIQETFYKIVKNADNRYRSWLDFI